MTPNPTSDRDPNQSRQHSRRTALTTIAAVGATSLSGCLGILGDGDSTTTPEDSGTNGTPTATATRGYTLPDYTKWAYPLGTRDGKSEFVIRQWDPQTVINNEQAVPSGIRDGMDRAMVDQGVYLEGIAKPEDVESLVVIDGNRIYDGSWSASEVQDSVEAFTNVESAGELGNYTLYKNTKTGSGLAVTDGRFITSLLPDDGVNEMESEVEVVKLLINTYGGEATRFGESSTGFDLLFDDADVGYFNQAIIQPTPDTKTDYRFAALEGKLGELVTNQLDGDATAGAFRVLFDSAESASEQLVQEFSNEGPLFSAWSDTSVSQLNDRVFTITGSISAE